MVEGEGLPTDGAGSGGGTLSRTWTLSRFVHSIRLEAGLDLASLTHAHIKGPIPSEPLALLTLMSKMYNLLFSKSKSRKHPSTPPTMKETPLKARPYLTTSIVYRADCRVLLARIGDWWGRVHWYVS